MPSLWDATSIYWLAKSFSNCSTTFSKVSGLHCSSKKYTVQDTTEIFLPPESNRYSPDRTGVPIWYLYYFYDIFWIYGKGREKDQCQLLMQKTGWTNHSAFQSGHSFSLVWSSLVLYGLVLLGKRVLPMALITWMHSTTIFLKTRKFWHGDEQRNNQVNLEQACIWPVRGQSFRKSNYMQELCVLHTDSLWIQ